MLRALQHEEGLKQPHLEPVDLDKLGEIPWRTGRAPAELTAILDRFMQPVEVTARDVTATADADYYYHVTYARNLPSIQSRGLLPNALTGRSSFGDLSDQRAIYLTDEPGVAGYRKFFSSDPLVLRVSAEILADWETQVEPDPGGDIGPMLGLTEPVQAYMAVGEDIAEEGIPPEWIEAQTREGDWVPLSEVSLEQVRTATRPGIPHWLAPGTPIPEMYLPHPEPDIKGLVAAELWEQLPVHVLKDYAFADWGPAFYQWATSPAADHWWQGPKGQDFSLAVPEFEEPWGEEVEFNPYSHGDLSLPPSKLRMPTARFDLQAAALRALEVA